MDSIIKIAFQLLKPKADKYEPVCDAHYLLIISDDGSREDGEDECCGNCVDAMIAQANVDRPLQNGDIYIAERYDPAFGANLTSAFICQYCLEYGDYPITPDDQELSHWESLDDDRFIDISEPEAWELCNFFENSYEGNKDGKFRSEHYDRVESLAKRIVDLSEKEASNG